MQKRSHCLALRSGEDRPLSTAVGRFSQRARRRRPKTGKTGSGFATSRGLLDISSGARFTAAAAVHNGGSGTFLTPVLQNVWHWGR